MTEDQHAAVVRSAEADPALLSGRPARLAMFCISCVLSAGPMLFFIPHFTDWRGVVGYVVAVLVTLCGPLMALLIPKKDQEQYRQALIESEERRRKLSAELETSRGISASFGRKPKS